MPSLPAYIARNRHGTYYFRIVVPLPLRLALGLQREVRRSLQTDSQRLALRRARQYAARYQSAFDKVLDVMGRDDFEPTDEDMELYSELISQGSKPEAWGAWSEASSKTSMTTPSLTNAELEERQRRSEVAKVLNGAYGRPVPPHKEAVARQLLELSAPYPATQLRKVLPGILEQVVKQQISGARAQAAPAVASSLRPEAMSLTLYELWQLQWENEESLNKGKALSTKDAECAHARRLTILSGSKPIGALTVDDFNRIYAQIPSIKPSRGTRIPVDADADSILAKDGEKRINASSAEKIIIRLGALHTFAFRKDYSSVDPSKTDKPRIDLQPPGKSKKEKTFSQSDLKAIFTGYLYAGIDIGSVGKIFPYQFWLPLIGLFTGGRLNEICQLDTEDVQFDDESGLWSISIMDDEKDRPLPKALKNTSSRRILPIHDELIRIGFLDFVERAKTEGREKLFSDGLTYSARKGWGGIATTFFSRMPSESTKFGGYFHRVGIRSRKANGETDEKTFHTFRHTFIDLVRNTGAEALLLLEAFTGHAKKERSEADSYGKGFYLKNKHRVLHSVAFSGDVSHITYAEFEKRLGMKIRSSVEEHRKTHGLNQSERLD